MKVWFPTIKTNSGSDKFVERLAQSLSSIGIEAEITWYPHWREIIPLRKRDIFLPVNVDIIHVNSWHGYVFSHFGKPIVSTCHHSVHDKYYKHFSSFLQKFYYKFLVYRFEKKTFSHSTVTTVVSEYTSSLVTQHFPGVYPVVILNGIDTSFYKPIKEYQNTKTLRILYVGNASRRKGTDLLAPIMKQLGEGFELRYSAGLSTKNLSIEGNCTKLESLSDADLLREYQSCDIVLFPSRYEGFGYVACEAMSCGKVVVACRNTALPELIDHGKTGILCATDDVNGMVDAIRQLAENFELRKNIGRNARVIAEERFNESRMVNEYVLLYEKLLCSLP